MDSNSKRKQQSLRMAGIRNVISDNSSPNLRKTLPAIPIIPTITIPAIRNRASPIRLVEEAVTTFHQCGGFKRMSTKATVLTSNALAGAADTTQPTFVPNTASCPHLTRTPAITAAMTACKSSTKHHSTCSSKITSLPLSFSNTIGVAGHYRVGIGEFGGPSLVCNL